MAPDYLLQQLAFIRELDKAKDIQRKKFAFEGPHADYRAAYNWHLTVMALVLAEHANEPVDLLRVLKMLLLLHIAEIDSGQVFAFNTVLDWDNTIPEREAAERIFNHLPPEQARELLAIWEEFETGDTPEARFACAMVRLEPVLQRAFGKAGKRPTPSDEKAVARAEAMRRGSKTLWDYAKALLGENIANDLSQLA